MGAGAVVGGILKAAKSLVTLGAKKGAKTVAKKKAKKQKELVKSSKGKPPAQRSPKEIKARKNQAKQLRQQREAKRIKKNAKVKSGTTGFKGKLKGMLGTGGVGGLIGSMLGGSEDPPNTPVGAPGTAEPPQKTPAEILDKTIDLSWMPQALAVSIPRIELPEEERASSLIKVTAVEDIELDEEGGYPFIQSGTIIPSRIAEIGQLFKITDALRGQTDELNKQLVITNANLNLIKKALKDAIGLNLATNRANERRRDENDQEKKRGPITGAVMLGAGLAAGYVTAKTAGFLTRAMNVATMGAIALFADDVGAWLTDDEEEPEIQEEEGAADPTDDKQYASSLEDAQEGEYLTDDQMRELGLDPPDDDGVDDGSEEEPVAEEEVGLLDQAIAASEEGVSGALLTASTITGVAGLAASGGVAAATAMGVAAPALLVAAAPVLAVAAGVTAAAGVGYMAGKLIADNTEIDEKLGEMMFGGGDVDLEDVEATSDEEMEEKYSGMADVDKFADILGEGMFDVAESESDIKAAFKDMIYDEWLDLGERYQETHGTPLSEAVFSAVGMEGLNNIMDTITENTVAKKLAEEPVEEDPIVEVPTNTDGITGEDVMEQPATDGITAEIAETPTSTDGITGEDAESTSYEDTKFYTRESAQIYKDLREGKISGSEALKRMKENSIRMEDAIPGGISIRDLKEDAQETLQLPDVGEVVPISEILEQVPGAIQQDVANIVAENVEKPINEKLAGLQENIDSVVDETVDQAIKATLMPIIRQGQAMKETPIPAGTQAKSGLDGARPNYMSIDPFVRIKMQT